MSKAIRVTTATFEEQVLLAEQPVIVDFYADWCGPCKMLSPVLEQLASEHTEIKITKVNVDEEPALAERYRIRGIPYVAMFRDGKLANQVVGYQTKAALEANLGLNGAGSKPN
jgi:thioredoxin